MIKNDLKKEMAWTSILGIFVIIGMAIIIGSSILLGFEINFATIYDGMNPPKTLDNPITVTPDGISVMYPAWINTFGVIVALVVLIVVVVVGVATIIKRSDK